jgi:peptidylprolyl isomerase
MKRRIYMQAKKGDKIRVHYTVKSENGEMLDSSVSKEPLEITIGKCETIQGFEDGIIDMKPGDKKTIRVPVDQAYGPREDKKIFEFPKERAPKDFDPKIGQVLQLHRPDGTNFPVTVIGYTDTGYKMDANHPLAGKDLVFDLELVEILK